MNTPASTDTPREFIRPGEPWLDDRGHHIQAHGGGVIKLGDTWFWFGDDRSQANDPAMRFVACYSSKNLVNWTFRNQVLQLSDPDQMGPTWVVERPKVYFNRSTRKYVLYFHLDAAIPARGPGYQHAKVGVAVSDTVDGHYTFLRSFRPLGKESRDIGQFIDDDGAPYLIFECRPSKGFYIAALSEDYLDVAKEVAFVPAPLESGALVHHQGLYYVIGSQLTGWDPNPNKYATATRLQGPWSPLTDIAPPHTNTYGSQVSNLVKIVGTRKTTVIYVGDIWRPHTQWDSRYFWMPLDLDGGRLWLRPGTPWTVDVVTGEVTS